MTTVLISGASVAGPALAYWLHRYGFTPTVVERAPAPRPGGYAVDFRGASMKVQAVDGARWFIPGSKWFAALRNLTYRMIPYLPWRRMIQELSLKVGNAIELRTYEDLPRPPAARRP